MSLCFFIVFKIAKREGERRIGRRSEIERGAGNGIHVTQAKVVAVRVAVTVERERREIERGRETVPPSTARAAAAFVVQHHVTLMSSERMEVFLAAAAAAAAAGEEIDSLFAGIMLTRTVASVAVGRLQTFGK